MKTKQQKRNEAKKVAEARSASRKQDRDKRSGNSLATPRPGQKGRSLVPQVKKKK